MGDAKKARSTNIVSPIPGPRHDSSGGSRRCSVLASSTVSESLVGSCFPAGFSVSSLGHHRVQSREFRVCLDALVSRISGTWTKLGFTNVDHSFWVGELENLNASKL